MQHSQDKFKTKRGLLPFIAGLFTLFFLFALAGSVSAIPTTPEIMIDGFDTGQQIVFTSEDFGGSNPAFSIVSASAAIGGSRKARLDSVDASLRVRPNASIPNPNLNVGTGDPVIDWTATIIWDGTLAASGWNGTDIAFDQMNVDLINVSEDVVADGIFFSVVGWEGNNIDITLRIYSSAADWSEATYEVRGDGDIGDYEVSLPFFEIGVFDTHGGSGANFDSVVAIVLTVETVESGADIVLDLTASGPTRDFGDLPDSYKTTLAEDGPRHSRGNIFLGETVSSELDARVPLDGTGDGDTDDGIVPVGTDATGTRWVNGANGGAVEVTWTSPFNDGRACLDGWIDWHYDVATNGNPDSFEETTGPIPGGGTAVYSLAEKHVVQGHRLSGIGDPPFTDTIAFNVPTGYFDTEGGEPIGLASRWRIYPADVAGNCLNGGIDYFGYIENGEVEDYIWGFTPTAVGLIGFQTSTVALPWVMGVLVLALLTGLLLVVRRRQTVTA